jgi:hypothetical protein
LEVGVLGFRWLIVRRLPAGKGTNRISIPLIFERKPAWNRAFIGRAAYFAEKPLAGELYALSQL